MSDFIIIQKVTDIPNYQDFQDLSSLASQINQTCGISHKYIGMHLSERILYLTYYIKYGFSQARCYKIDIQIEKGLDGKPTGNYDSATLCCNMQNFISQLTNAGGAIQ